MNERELSKAIRRMKLSLRRQGLSEDEVLDRIYAYLARKAEAA